MTVRFLQNHGIFLQPRNLRQFSSQPSIHRHKKSDDLGALQDILTSPPNLINVLYRILLFPWKVDFRVFSYEICVSLHILSGTLFSVQNNRWILTKRKIAETSWGWAGPSSAQLPTSSLLLWFHIWGCFLFVTDSWGWVPQKSIQTRLISIVSKPTKVVIVVVVVVIVFVVFPKKS